MAINWVMYILLLADAEIAELDDISEPICNQNSATDFCTEMGWIWLHKSALVVYGDVSIQIDLNSNVEPFTTFWSTARTGSSVGIIVVPIRGITHLITVIWATWQPAHSKRVKYRNVSFKII